MVNIQNFYILKESGFIETYNYIGNALDYYYNDPKYVVGYLGCFGVFIN